MGRSGWTNFFLSDHLRHKTSEFFKEMALPETYMQCQALQKKLKQDKVATVEVHLKILFKQEHWQSSAL